MNECFLPWGFGVLFAEENTKHQHHYGNRIARDLKSLCKSWSLLVLRADLWIEVTEEQIQFRRTFLQDYFLQQRPELVSICEFPVRQYSDCLWELFLQQPLPCLGKLFRVEAVVTREPVSAFYLKTHQSCSG